MDNSINKLSTSLLIRLCRQKELETSQKDKMFEQRHTETPLLLTVAVLLLLAAGGRSAVLTDSVQTTQTPLSNSSLITQLNSTMETPVVLPLHRPCGSQHDTFCANGGKCMYPQDSNEPSCICEHMYGGPRCMLAEPTHGFTLPDVDQVIGIILGIFILIIFLAIAVYFLAQKKCTKSALPIKYVPSETSV